MSAAPGTGATGWGARRAWPFAAAGAVAAVGAAIHSGSDARSAAAQDWSPFVLVSGLLLVGLVADDDGLFAAAGDALARLSRRGVTIFVGVSVLIGVTTALLNLDTSVAFVTPVVVYLSRRRPGLEAPLLYACILLANAGSLFLTGSNLTNLIVLGHLHVTGAAYVAHMWLPALAAFVVTAGVIGLSQRRSLSLVAPAPPRGDSPTVGVGLVATVLVTVVVVVVRAPALPVVLIGVGAAGTRLRQGRLHPTRVWDALGLPVLVGLFGLAVALGALGRSWTGPASLLAHLDAWGTAGVAAVCAVLVNNLPAASLLAARTPPHPYALLVGLNVGPNLFVTGSLAWFLWLRAARGAGAHPSVSGAVRVGLVAVPLALAVAVGALVLLGSA